MSIAYSDGKTTVTLDEDTVTLGQFIGPKNGVAGQTMTGYTQVVVSRAAWREIANGVAREIEQECEAKP
jgi:hypothetical protein